MIRNEVDDAEAQRIFSNLAGLQKAKIMRRVGDIAEQLTRERFRTETAPSGTAWAPHRKTTIERRERKGSASRALLIDTGALYGSIKSEHSEFDATVSIGGAGIFANVQQDGNDSNRMFGGPLAPIPARPFVPKSDNLPPAYLDALVVPVHEAIREAIA